MPSPFPGMDPYLESPAYWPDFHARFVNYWCEAVADALPGPYDARILDYVSWIEAMEGQGTRVAEPDVIVGPPASVRSERKARPPEGAFVCDSVTLDVAFADEERTTYIEVLHRPDHALVAVLELLSPANKEAPGRSLYLAKRHSVLLQPVHLVELDLLLKGQRPPIEGALPPADYYCYVSRGDRRPQCEVYHWTMRQPLPALPVPLRAPDPDVWVDLAAVFRTTYERGRYARSLDYARPPAVALSPEQRAWVEPTARGAGPR